MLCRPLRSHKCIIAEVHDLCHKRLKYSRLHTSVLGYVHMNTGVDIKLVELLGNSPFCMTTKMLIVQYRKTLIWENTRKGLNESRKIIYG
jgi:hypothetical protein